MHVCAAIHCWGKRRNRSISICLFWLLLHLWAMSPSNYFPSCAFSTRTQIALEGWSVLDFHKVLWIFPFYSTLVMPTSSRGECLAQDLSLRDCVERPFLHSCSTGLSYEAEAFWWAGGTVAPSGSCVPYVLPGCPLEGQGSSSHSQVNISTSKMRPMKGCGKESTQS